MPKENFHTFTPDVYKHKFNLALQILENDNNLTQEEFAEVLNYVESRVKTSRSVFLELDKIMEDIEDEISMDLPKTLKPSKKAKK